jgi:AcrR family transcriptional regulator
MTEHRAHEPGARRFSERVAAQRDTEIRESALTCFNLHGCFGTDLDRVAAAVGIGKGTLYRHYSSKQELLASALVTGIDRLLSRCKQLLELHGADSLSVIVADLIALNRANDPASPASLDRMLCGSLWSGAPLSPTLISNAFATVVRTWQSLGVIVATADASWVAGVILALINAPEVGSFHVGQFDPTAVEPAPNVAVRVADIVQRAFGAS